jgi:hypothetical protein
MSQSTVAAMFLAVVCCMTSAVPVFAADGDPLPPVEEWQVKGLRAALKDEYPEVQAKALEQLEGWLRKPYWARAKREWHAGGELQSLLTDLFDRLKPDRENRTKVIQILDLMARADLLKDPGVIERFVQEIKLLRADREEQSISAALETLVRATSLWCFSSS